MLKICLWNCKYYRSFYDEIRQWAEIQNKPTVDTHAFLCLNTNPKHLKEAVRKAINDDTTGTDCPIIVNPCFDEDVMRSIFSMASHTGRSLIVLDYKSFDRDIRMLNCRNRIYHVDIKSYYPDGPPLKDEMFFNAMVLQQLIGPIRFCGPCEVNACRGPNFDMTSVYWKDHTTAVLYCGTIKHMIADIVHVVGDDKYECELSIPQDTGSYYERYGAAIQSFITNARKLDYNFHRDKALLTFKKLKFN